NTNPRPLAIAVAQPSHGPSVPFQQPPTPPQPPASSSSMVRVSCSGCSKILQKGQTAFQRKGSNQLFCSTVCLTGFTLPPTRTNHLFLFCFRDILQPKDLIKVPVDNITREFCSQVCLMNFTFKKNAQLLFTWGMNCVQLCSDSCFSRFCVSHNLTINCCEACGQHCSSSTGNLCLLQADDTLKKFCSSTCITRFRQVVTCACSRCHVQCPAIEMQDCTNVQGITELFCTQKCQTSSSGLSGTPFPCTNCQLMAISQYHLAMPDGSIRNFCSYESFGPGSTHNTTVQYGPAPGVPHLHEVYQQHVSPGSGYDCTHALAQVSCNQCSLQFCSKPQVLHYKGHVWLFCGKTCCEVFKRNNNVTALCEYCKLEKVVKDIIKFGKRLCNFCSDGCKLLFKHDLLKKTGSQCKTCAYCGNLADCVVSNHFSSKVEEFCSKECMSLYTVLFYEMARCDLCRKRGALREALRWGSEMRYFCAIHCLLNFCQQTTLNLSSITPLAHTYTGSASAPVSRKITSFSKEMPVIRGVVSLASALTGQPQDSSHAVLPGMRWHCASTQTDCTKLTTPPRRLLKNKALMCKPLTEDQKVRLMPFPVPVPVPVFLPVPMHMYTQYTPVPIGVPVLVGIRTMPVKEDILLCCSSELSNSLYHFVREVKQPDGHQYTADRIFCFCLGIQKYLIDNDRNENIFTDSIFIKFATEITRMLRNWTRTVESHVLLQSCVEEDYLWQCKLLGTYSPLILLNTLLFFATKFFQFTTLCQHQHLAFAGISHCYRNTPTGKITYLRFKLPELPAGDDNEEDFEDLEMPENTENPLHCPIRLYEFYLSKCPKSVRNRRDVFYLQPEHDCDPSSPLWYSNEPLDSATLESLLARILTVRQVNLNTDNQQEGSLSDEST
uniref:TRASH domain-containing protein n=1 Tax=Denticeps clupeoides TaxID=299321 RepID=A0AAY4B9H2_9TELE